MALNQKVMTLLNFAFKISANVSLFVLTLCRKKIAGFKQITRGWP